MTQHINAEQLVGIVYRDVFMAAVDDSESVLRNPPGRAAGDRAARLQQWYQGLAEADRDNVRMVMRESAFHSVFGMLCLLDNVRPIADGFKQEIRVSIQSGDTRADIGPGQPLHEIFTAIVRASEG